jgi:hypothetical protein
MFRYKSIRHVQAKKFETQEEDRHKEHIPDNRPAANILYEKHNQQQHLLFQ